MLHDDGSNYTTETGAQKYSSCTNMYCEQSPLELVTAIQGVAAAGKAIAKLPAGSKKVLLAVNNTVQKGRQGLQAAVANKGTNSVLNNTGDSALYAKYVNELKELDRQTLLDELTFNGVKHTPENIVDVRKTPNGQVVFLEIGDKSAGLGHILLRHKQDFANVGIHADQIPDVVMTAVTHGKIVGYQGKNNGRTVYEIIYNDTRHRIAVTTSDNGFIVGANPQSRLAPYISK
ncbi:hypothetical protein [Parendozoicomonas sp. Alg238-R29]|uniref:hypothetical protein n=1 Tax=Parendozoicomonas sp. Alg238-R29 TaxID=2993446 RepID=UPI00248F26EF|nr:hypothetical protein [Parendozoicomonas sp. Alg238-R29]